jgi:hypothetical protein
MKTTQIPATAARSVPPTPAGTEAVGRDSLAENRRLAGWLGTWNYEGENYATAIGPAARFRGRMSARLIQDGYASEFVYEETGPAGATRYLEIVFWDPLAGDHGYLMIGNDGYVERGVLTVFGNVATFESSVMAAGVPARIRGTRVLDERGDQFVRNIEICADGRSWQPFLRQHFIRQPATTAPSASH